MRRRGSRGRRLNVESLESRRLLSLPGSLDSTFSGDGKATVAISGQILTAVDVAVQTDGKAVVAGTKVDSSGNINIALARFTVDGLADPTFGNQGLVTTDLFNLFEEEVHALAIAPNGKIVVVGKVFAGKMFSENELLVLRYNPEGSLDTTFSEDGRVVLDLGPDSLDGDSEAFNVAVQPDGQIVVVGKTYRIPDDDFFVLRLRDDGSRDVRVLEPITGKVLNPGFDLDGVKFIDFDGDDTANTVKLDSAGTMYVAGTADIDGHVLGAVAKINKLGGFVNSFDDNGRLAFELPGRTLTTIQDLILQGDKIVIAGDTLDLSGKRDFFVARLTSAGDLDTTFGDGNNGYSVADLGGNDVVRGITLTPTGGGGGFIVSGSSDGKMAAVKFTDNGGRDTSFGSFGTVRLSINGAANIAPGPGRRFMLAGGADFATARLLLNGARRVSVTTGDALAVEGTTNTATLFVGRTERLPFSTRVFFSVGGTANFTNTAATRTGSNRDYSLPGMVSTSATSGFVDIPANETFVLLTLTPVNDSLQEGNETASFTIVANSIYELTSQRTGTITIVDDDTPNSSLGTSAIEAPPKQVGVGEELQAAVTWTVPSGGWRQLSSIQLRLRDIHYQDVLAVLTFDEATNSFSVEASPAAGDNPVSLVFDKCKFQAAGPDSPTVTVIFTFRLNASAAQRRFALDVAAMNDSGEFSGFEQVGEVHVHKKPRRAGSPLPPRR